MDRRFLGAIVILAAIALAASASTPDAADAQETITLRIATLAPRGSQWDRAFRAWGNTLRQQTNGRLRLRFYLGGAQGDERDYVRKIRAGQLDGAAITTTGLGQIVRPVMVLSVPGLMREYRQVDRVRAALSDEFDSQFSDAGFKFLGWGDVGRGRLFSNRPIARPDDLKRVRPWVWREDVIFTEMLNVIGANGQRLGINEVLPALQTGRIDAFPSTALAAVSLQWWNHATHVSQQAESVAIGATVMSKEKFDSLPADLQQALTETSARAHTALNRSIRRTDDRAFNTLTSRGVTAVDMSAHQAEWERVGRQVRNRLAGRLYPRALLERVERAARGR